MALNMECVYVFLLVCPTQLARVAVWRDALKRGAGWNSRAGTRGGTCMCVLCFQFHLTYKWYLRVVNSFTIVGNVSMRIPYSILTGNIKCGVLCEDGRASSMRGNFMPLNQMNECSVMHLIECNPGMTVRALIDMLGEHSHEKFERLNITTPISSWKLLLYTRTTDIKVRKKFHDDFKILDIPDYVFEHMGLLLDTTGFNHAIGAQLMSGLVSCEYIIASAKTASMYVKQKSDQNLARLRSSLEEFRPDHMTLYNSMLADELIECERNDTEYYKLLGLYPDVTHTEELIREGVVLNLTPASQYYIV